MRMLCGRLVELELDGTHLRNPLPPPQSLLASGNVICVCGRNCVGKLRRRCRLHDFAQSSARFPLQAQPYMHLRNTPPESTSLNKPAGNLPANEIVSYTEAATISVQ